MSVSSDKGRSSSLALARMTGPEGGKGKQTITGFASIVNLEEEGGTVSVTKSRRIQINQLDSVQSEATEVVYTKMVESGSRQKRWSFHTSNPISAILKEDKVIKPIVSPPPRRSSSAFALAEAKSSRLTVEENEHKDKSHGSSGGSMRNALSSTSHNNYRHHHHHHRHGRLIPLEDPTMSRTDREKIVRYLEHKSLRQNCDMESPTYHIFKRHKSKSREPPTPDYLSNLPDEVLMRVLKFLPKPALGNLARTSHRFLGLIVDESLWKRVCLMSKLLEPEHLMVIMSRKPVYLRLARASISDPINTSSLDALISSSQLKFLDLSSVQVSQQTLALIIRMSPNLVKLSLEHLVASKPVLESMLSFAKTIEVLNLAMCYELDAQALIKFYKSCPKLKELNMGCVKVTWTPEELTDVVKSLPKTLQQLNISGFRHLFDDSHVQIISNNCPKLVELDISDSQEVKAKSIEYLLNLTNLQHLGLSRCYGIEPPVYTLLASHRKLKYLDLFSLFKENSIRQLSTNLPGIEINKFPFSAIARPTVGNKRSSIWMQRVRD